MVYRPRYLKKQKNKSCIVNLEIDKKLIGQIALSRATDTLLEQHKHHLKIKRTINY